jgi:hypothetical protein
VGVVIILYVDKYQYVCGIIYLDRFICEIVHSRSQMINEWFAVDLFSMVLFVCRWSTFCKFGYKF